MRSSDDVASSSRDRAALWRALAVSLTLGVSLALGCADSHGLEVDAAVPAPDAPDVDAPRLDAPSPPVGCGSGTGPACHDARLNCCIRSTCVGTAWMCPLGTTPEGMCTARGGACDVRSCGRPSDCVVVPESCCGTCGAATPEDVTAVNGDAASEHRASACAGVAGCDLCFMTTDPHLTATCSAATAQCEPVDLGSAEWAGCASDAECVLRLPDCCACGPGGEPIALRLDRLDELAGALCDPDSGCLGCEPDFSPRVARCETGLCVVR